jgi:hypothetical protein
VFGGGGALDLLQQLLEFEGGIMKLSMIMLLCLSLLLFGCGQQKRPVEATANTAGQSAEEELDARIPPDDPEKYKSIQDANDWQNPYLVVEREGIAIRCLAISETDWQIIPPEELRKRLIELPVSAWPYGRVVAVQEIAIRSRDDDKYITSNKTKVASALRSLGIKNNGWPSA